MQQRIIVLGGMGPQASLELHRRIIATATQRGAKTGDQFPHIVHLSLPVPDFISNTKRKEEALRMIISQVKEIVIKRGDTVVIACNTAHLLQSEIEKYLPVPITSMIDATVDGVAGRYDAVKLLATPTTLRTGIYRRKLEQAGVGVIEPTVDEQSILEHTIRSVIAHQPVDCYITSDLPILLGCTELSCAYAGRSGVIDPIESLMTNIIAKGVL